MTKEQRLKEIALVSLKLGSIGFGGIAGMIATMEEELVKKRQWIDHQHFMDVVSTSNIVPGPNSVEIMMHCGKERGGKTGLLIAGIGYILPTTLLCLLLGFLYTVYGKLPQVQEFVFGIRPATTALVIGTVIRLVKTNLQNNYALIIIAGLVCTGSLYGLSEILLIVAAGIVYYVYYRRKQLLGVNMVLIPFLYIQDVLYSNQKLFFLFLKIGAILYGSGFVLFAYMDNALVRSNHWLTKQQLLDAISVGQITPGPILSSATFAGYLIQGPMGAVLATVGIFLPSFFISLFLHRLLSSARKSQRLRIFLDGLNAASIAVIAAVGIQLLSTTLENWQGGLILSGSLLYIIFSKKLPTLYIILAGSILGYCLLKLPHFFNTFAFCNCFTSVLI